VFRYFRVFRGLPPRGLSGRADLRYHPAMIKLSRLALLYALLVPLMAQAQRLEFAPGVRYAAAIPTLKQATGHEFGERVTSPEEIIRYLKALHEAAPDRTRLIKYAETWEGRELYTLIVASPERIKGLDAIKSGLQRLASGDAEQLKQQLPVVVALIHGVHGNEASSGEAALYEAYHLLAAEGDANVDLIRREAVVLIDPMQNPDGRARFVYQNLLGQAASPDPEPAAAEHDEPWPSGRSNHYLFDLNRDWFAQTQPESRGRVKLLLEWAPQVVADLHEMGGDSTYYFPPAADPPNPHQTKAQSDWLSLFGKKNAERFDERGFAYFNREVFDAFYPGYGVSWPTAQGAIGMTFEMASARGLIFRRQDGGRLTYLDGAVRHFTNAMTTLTTAARNRERLLRDFVEFRRNAGSGPIKTYILPPGEDPGQALRLAQTLIQNGILVNRAEEPIKVDNRTFPAGSYLVPLPQPAGMLARNLLDAQVPMNPEFLKRQEERRKRRLPDQIYDITAWNLPMLYDVECATIDRSINVKTTAVGSSPGRATTAPLVDAVVGYALPWNATSAAATVEALDAGLQAEFLAQPFSVSGRKIEHGAAVFRLTGNPAEMKSTLGSILAKHGVEAVKLDTAFVLEGISLGSNQTVPLRTPKVLLAWDAPASSLSAGWARYVLERRYGQAVTAVRTSSFGRVDLYRFTTIILPAGTYSFSPEILRKLKDWINAGGTLITLGEASRWAARESLGLLETRTEMRDGTVEMESPGLLSGPSGQARAERPAISAVVQEYDRAIQPARELPELVPGALLRVTLDPDHWLSSGSDGEIQVMVESTRVFAPIKLDRGRNVGIYTEKDRLLSSGLIWDVALNQLPQKAFLIHQPMGQGHLIAFAEDPNYRAYAEMTQFLFLNAVLLGPAY
jgi:hypothetical protein